MMEVLPHLFPRTAQLTTKLQSSCVAHMDAHARMLHALALFYSEENSMGLVETRFPKAHTLYPEIRLQNNTFPTSGITGTLGRMEEKVVSFSST